MGFPAAMPICALVTRDQVISHHIQELTYGAILVTLLLLLAVISHMSAHVMLARTISHRSTCRVVKRLWESEVASHTNLHCF